jgi:hypothetical protein
MKKITAVLFIFFVAMATGTAQYAQKKLSAKQKFIDFTENPNPGLHSVPPEYANEPAYIVQWDEALEYVYEGKGINAYKTQHTIWKVLDEKGVEAIKAVDIPVDGQTRFLSIKARTIRPDGKVQEIPQTMIKVTTGGSGRKIVMAPEGLEKYSEVELMVKTIVPGRMFGGRYFQFGIPVLNARWDISYPKDLVFEAKGYNGMEDMRDTLLGHRRHMQVSVSDVRPLKKEPYSFYDLYRMQAEFKLHHYEYKNYNNRAEVLTWDRLGRVLFDENYNISPKERGAVNRYLTELGVQAGGNEEENIKKIENGIKNSIVLYPFVPEDSAGSLDSIIAKRQATHAGYVKLFAACFTQAGVVHELGKAEDKSEHRIRKDVENWFNLDYTLFYFPNREKFLYPLSIHYRYPVVPDEIAGANGVFCLIPPKGIVSGMLAEVRRISPLKASETEKNMAAGVNFNDDMEATIDVSYAFSGYASADLRTALTTQTKDKEQDIVTGIINFAEKREDIIKYDISNERPESYNSNKPLVVTASVSAPFLTEKAGKKYLFNIGELIDARPALYDKKERKLPIDLAYPETGNRTITVNIPKGYKVVNPEALKMHAEYVNRDLKTLCSFTSDYTLITDKKKGDKLVVTVKDHYPVPHFPVTDYERFKGVVNAAADFNKTAILLEQKPGYVKPKAVAKK